MGPAPCPVCSQILRKTNFYQQIFEDLTVEKEIRIRTRINRIFNARPADFENLKAYNDYLEHVEDITFKLLNNENVQEAEDEISRYTQINKKKIEANLEKQKREKRLEKLKETQVKKEKEKSLEEYVETLELEKKQKRDAKAQVLFDLATKDKDASEIIKESNISLKRSSARIKAKIENPEHLHTSGDIDYDNDLFEEDDETLDRKVDPFEDSYKPVAYVNVKKSYIDNNSNIKNAFLYNGGFTNSTHYKYLLDSAFSGIDVPKPT
ncbi:RNA polymerase II transcription factor B subunit 3 [Smittium mucronatum]|uniref:RNA polymerase II transcription factor B subunit 3 n=1 Tax=Smittium mucronatum TaxID=133383 RepID=A0A1R0H263_9FUNG|nr:RNA polymerase II transcription factor B subunit 3 [Smittium mucronatum]